MVAFLEKSTGSTGFHRVIDFLNRSHICSALTKKPDVYISLIIHFWWSAEDSTNDNGEVQITATIDCHSMSITEANKLTFQKGAFSPQWRFLIHNILHCLSPKKTAWEQFSSNIATAICRGTNFNDTQEHILCYLFCIKVFNNMKRPTKGYSGQEVALFPTMLNVSEPSTSPSRITSSPSHSPEPSPSHSPEPSPSHSPAPSIEHLPDHTTAAVSLPSPTQPTQPSPGVEQHIPTPHDSPLYVVHSHGSDEGSLKLIELATLVTKLSERIGVLEDDLKKTKLTYSAAVTEIILRVKKLEAKVKAGTARKRARVVLSGDDEDVEDDSSNKGRKLSDAEDHRKASNTAGRTVTYRRRSEEKRTRKDKGKAIMTEPEPKKKLLGMKKFARQGRKKKGSVKAMSEAINLIVKPKEIDWKDPVTWKLKRDEVFPKKIEEEDVRYTKEMKEVLKNFRLMYALEERFITADGRKLLTLEIKDAKS
ncbi:hypothetical protein Tco_0572763 [Tanacetum coccineum]